MALRNIFLLVSIILCPIAGVHAQADNRLQWVLPPRADQIPLGIPSPNTLMYRQDGQTFALIAGNSPVVLPYDSLSHNTDAFWQIWKNGLSGIYHSEKGELIPPVYEHIAPVAQTPGCWAFVVKKYGMTAVANDQNRLVLPWREEGYGKLALVGDSILEYQIREISYVGRSGGAVADAVARKQKPPDFQRISSDRYVLAYVKNGQVRRDTFRAAESFVQDLALVRRDSLWGYLRRNGSWLIAPRFQAAQPFDALGHAVVKAKGRYGIVRRDGSYLVQPAFHFLKPVSLLHFEFKEGERIGVTDTLGNIVLAAGQYTEFTATGPKAFAARLADSLLLFRNDGWRIPIHQVKECSGDSFGDQFIVKKSFVETGGRPYTLSGVATSEGIWLIPPVLGGYLWQRPHFFIAGVNIHECCSVPGLDIDKNQLGKYLIFNRKGQPVLPYAVEATPFVENQPYGVFKLNNQFGLFTDLGPGLDPEYDELRLLPNGWIFARRGMSRGVLKWVE